MLRDAGKKPTMDPKPRQHNPTCPHCGAEAHCLGRDCGAGTQYHDYFLLWCDTCKLVVAHIERGGDTAADNWFNACPYCGAEDNAHGDTPPEDVTVLALNNTEGELRAGNPEMRAPVCRHCGALGCCRSTDERVYEENQFYDYFVFACPNCGYREADYESCSTDLDQPAPCPFCHSNRYQQHFGNVPTANLDLCPPRKVSGVVKEGDPDKKKAA